MPVIGTLLSLTNGNVVDAGELNQNFSDIRTAFNTYALLTDTARTVTVPHTWSAGQTWGIAQQFHAGTVAAPGVAVGEADSGLYRIGVGNLGLAISGVKRWDYATAGSTLTGTLTVSGAATLQSTLAVTGAATLASTLGVTGATTLSSTLSVTGTATVGGAFTASANASVGGTLSVASSLSVVGVVTGGTYNGQTISAAASLTGSLAVAGATTLATTLSVTGNTTIGGTLGVTGAITGSLSGNATTATTLATSRDFSITGDGTATAVGFTGAGNVALSLTLGTVPIGKGGTGLTATPTNGQIPIGTGAGFALTTLTAGAGISVTNGIGTSTIANTGVTSLVAGTGISLSGGTGAVTVSNSGLNTVGQGAYRLGNQVLVANGSTQTIVYNTTEWGSGFLNTTTGYFTIPSGQGGTYLCQCNVVHNAANTNMQIFKNTTTSVAFMAVGTWGTIMKVLSLAAADTIDFRMSDNTSGVTITAGSNQTWASLTKLGV